MKKPILAVILVSCLFSSASAYDIIINRPFRGDVLKSGDRLFMSWQKKTGTVQPDFIAISLKHRGLNRTELIVPRTENDGRHAYDIPGTFPTGEYQLLFKTTDGAKIMALSNIFRINKVRQEPDMSPEDSLCEQNKDKTTDISIVRLRILRQTSQQAVLVVDIKNRGPRCVSAVWLTISQDALQLVDRMIDASFPGDGRTYLMTGGQEFSWQQVIARPRGNPQSTTIYARISVRPFNRDLDATTANNSKSITINWK